MRHSKLLIDSWLTMSAAAFNKGKGVEQ